MKGASREVSYPGIGTAGASFHERRTDSGGLFTAGVGGVQTILTPADGKSEFIVFRDQTLCRVASSAGYPAYYPVPEVSVKPPVSAVLMDLDGTSVRSETFWIGIIADVVAELSGRRKFAFSDADLPHVSGHSVSEHLGYAIGRYAPDSSLEMARDAYFRITRHKMARIMEGDADSDDRDAFAPTPGLKAFLRTLKSEGVRIALVTSGLAEKALPEIVSAFRAVGMGRPEEFYDAIITAGEQPGGGRAGTLGELEPKPHPWLYAEAARIGLGIDTTDPEARSRVIGLEDSAAGVVSLRLAGFGVIGIEGGNIAAAGFDRMLYASCRTLDEALRIILDDNPS